MIKLAVISFVLIFLLVTVMSLMIPGDIRISRAVNLRAQPQKVFGLIKNQENWKYWHPIYQDTAALKDWRNAHQQIVEDTDSTYVIRSKKENRNHLITGFQMYQYDRADSLTLQWYMDLKLSWYPWEKFSSLFFEQTYGVMMEQGLSNLKSYMHKEAQQESTQE